MAARLLLNCLWPQPFRLALPAAQIDRPPAVVSTPSHHYSVHHHLLPANVSATFLTILPSVPFATVDTTTPESLPIETWTDHRHPTHHPLDRQAGNQPRPSRPDDLDADTAQHTEIPHVMP